MIICFCIISLFFLIFLFFFAFTLITYFFILIFFISIFIILFLLIFFFFDGFILLDDRYWLHWGSFGSRSDLFELFRILSLSLRLCFFLMCLLFGSGGSLQIFFANRCFSVFLSRGSNWSLLFRFWGCF